MDTNRVYRFNFKTSPIRNIKLTSLYKSIISNFDPAFIFYQDYISGKWGRLSLPTQYEG